MSTISDVDGSIAHLIYLNGLAMVIDNYGVDDGARMRGFYCVFCRLFIAFVHHTCTQHKHAPP